MSGQQQPWGSAFGAGNVNMSTNSQPAQFGQFAGVGGNNAAFGMQNNQMHVGVATNPAVWQQHQHQQYQHAGMVPMSMGTSPAQPYGAFPTRSAAGAYSSMQPAFSTGYMMAQPQAQAFMQPGQARTNMMGQQPQQVAPGGLVQNRMASPSSSPSLGRKDDPKQRAYEEQRRRLMEFSKRKPATKVKMDKFFSDSNKADKAYSTASPMSASPAATTGTDSSTTIGSASNSSQSQSQGQHLISNEAAHAATLRDDDFGDFALAASGTAQPSQAVTTTSTINGQSQPNSFPGSITTGAESQPTAKKPDIDTLISSSLDLKSASSAKDCRGFQTYKRPQIAPQKKAFAPSAKAAGNYDAFRELSSEEEHSSGQSLSQAGPPTHPSSSMLGAMMAPGPQVNTLPTISHGGGLGQATGYGTAGVPVASTAWPAWSSSSHSHASSPVTSSMPTSFRAFTSPNVSSPLSVEDAPPSYMEAVNGFGVLILSSKHGPSKQDSSADSQPQLSTDQSAFGSFGAAMEASPARADFPAEYRSWFVECGGAPDLTGVVPGKAVYPLFMTSGLSKDVLKRVWSKVQKTTPGSLTFAEFAGALGLMSLWQTSGGQEATLTELESLSFWPVPKLKPAADPPQAATLTLVSSQPVSSSQGSAWSAFAGDSTKQQLTSIPSDFASTTFTTTRESSSAPTDTDDDGFGYFAGVQPLSSKSQASSVDSNDPYAAFREASASSSGNVPPLLQSSAPAVTSAMAGHTAADSSDPYAAFRDTSSSLSPLATMSKEPRTEFTDAATVDGKEQDDWGAFSSTESGPAAPCSDFASAPNIELHMKEPKDDMNVIGSMSAAGPASLNVDDDGRSDDGFGDFASVTSSFQTTAVHPSIDFAPAEGGPKAPVSQPTIDPGDDSYSAFLERDRGSHGSSNEPSVIQHPTSLKFGLPTTDETMATSGPPGSTNTMPEGLLLDSSAFHEAGNVVPSASSSAKEITSNGKLDDDIFGDFAAVQSSEARTVTVSSHASAADTAPDPSRAASDFVWGSFADSADKTPNEAPAQPVREPFADAFGSFSSSATAWQLPNASIQATKSETQSGTPDSLHSATPSAVDKPNKEDSFSAVQSLESPSTDDPYSAFAELRSDTASTGTDDDEIFGIWERILEKALVEMQSGYRLTQKVLEQPRPQVIAAQKRAQQFFEGMAEIRRVCLRISASLKNKTAGSGSTPSSGSLATCSRLCASIDRAWTALSADIQRWHPQALDVTMQVPNRNASGDTAQLCCICRQGAAAHSAAIDATNLSGGPGTASSPDIEDNSGANHSCITVSGRVYHSTCANLWLNRVGSILPT